MGTWSRRIAGKRAKYAGDNFEAQFENLCAIQGISVVPIPDSCKQVAFNRIVRIRSPFDYCICYKQRSAHIDTKSSEKTNFTYSMIDQYQLVQLKKLSPGGPSGYVIAMGERVYFVDVSILLDVKKHTSIDFTKCKYLGNRLAFDCRGIFE